jgi:hypothetical protein
LGLEIMLPLESQIDEGGGLYYNPGCQVHLK